MEGKPSGKRGHFVINVTVRMTGFVLEFPPMGPLDLSLGICMEKNVSWFIYTNAYI